MSLDWTTSVHDGETAHPWVFSTYLRGYLTASLMAKLVPAKVYYQVAHAACKDALGRYRLVIAHPGDTEPLFGWALGRPGLVWYVHVKPLYRRQGIASKLIKEAAGDCRHCEIAHITSAGQELLNSSSGRVWHLKQ